MTVELARVSVATAPEDFEHAGRLIREYYSWALGEVGLSDLGEVSPSAVAELADLTRHYRPPSAYLLLGRVDGTAPVAVCGLARQTATTAELKRLYVQPSARRHGLAWRLTTRAAWLARAMGCRRLRLETHTVIMRPAIALYRRFGFVESGERFTDIAVDGMVAYELDLAARRDADSLAL